MNRPATTVAFALAIHLAVACSNDAEVAAPADDAVEEQTTTEPPVPRDPLDPIEPVHDCERLRERANTVAADLVLLPTLCPGIELDRGQLKTVLLAESDPTRIAAMVAELDPHPELQGLARLAILDASSAAMPDALPNPATALVTPIDDRVLAAVELAHARLARPEDGGALEDIERTRAHALLARVYLHALQSLGLEPGRPLPPFARSLAARFAFHGRSFCRFYWQRRVAGLERAFAETEVALLELAIDLDNTAHVADGGLLAIERQRTRVYLQRSGPSDRIAARSRKRAEVRGLDTDLLLPTAHELDRLLDHGFIDEAARRARQLGGASGGPGLDPLAAQLTEGLRTRDLREYESRLDRAIERSRRKLDATRQAGSRVPEPELPVEWPSALVVAEQAQRWLEVARGRGPDFARNHARARAILLLRDRPDAVLDLLDPGEARVGVALSPAIAEHRGLLVALLEAHDATSLAALRVRTPAADAPDTRTRRRYALATRDAIMHPR